MKKFLKVFIIVLLVLAVIGGTCYFFFRKVKEKNNTTASFADMLQSESKLNFNSNLSTMAELVNSDGTDNRVDLIVETNKTLDSIVFALTTYYIEDNTRINNEAIANSLNSVNTSRSVLVSMMKEYNIKKDSAYFDRHLGANDFYRQASYYLVQYAGLANLINSSLEVNKQVDVKFNMFEVYSNATINTFNNLINSAEAANGRTIIKSDKNINLMNSIMILDGSYVETTVDRFSSTVREFNKYYKICDKTAFASNLASNVEVVGATETTNEKIATYYFKLIYGI